MDAGRLVKHILIVDDEEAVCWSLQRALAAEGHSVAAAASAEQAFALAAKRKPDAIILDVRLPGMDGLTALGRLRELSADAPVIVDYRLRQPLHRRPGRGERRLRLPHQAVRPRPGAGGRQAGAATPARAGTGRAGRRRPGRGGGVRRPQSRDAGGVQAHRPGGPTRRLGPHHRRKRNRKGAGRPRHPSPQRPPRPPLLAGPHRRPQSQPRRERAVRPRPRRLHRGGPGASRPTPPRRRRHHLPRRTRRHPAAGAGQIAARAGAQRSFAGRRDDSRSR